MNQDEVQNQLIHTLPRRLGLNPDSGSNAAYVSVLEVVPHQGEKQLRPAQHRTLDTPLEGLHATPACRLPYQHDVLLRSYALRRPQGSVIIHTSPESASRDFGRNGQTDARTAADIVRRHNLHLVVKR
jgi:hypothetical protein